VLGGSLVIDVDVGEVAVGVVRSCVERLQVVCDVLGGFEPGAGEEFGDLFDRLLATLALFVELFEAVLVPLDEVG